MFEKLGNKIRMAREEVNMSQKTLGISIGLSDKAISAYESGRTLPPLETLGRIAQEVSKPLRYFIVDDEDSVSVQDKIDRIEKLALEISKELEDIKMSLNQNRGKD